MAHTYGDAVWLAQKDRDGNVRRLNAIVLGSNLRVPTTLDRKPIEGAQPVEHLDLAFPVPVTAPGVLLKTRVMEEIFRPSYDVAPYAEGAWSGWEEVADESARAGDDAADGEQKPTVPYLSREKVREHIASQLEKGDPVCVPDGANLDDFFSALNEVLFGVAERVDDVETALKEAQEKQRAAEEALATVKGHPSAVDLDAHAAEQEQQQQQQQQGQADAANTE